MKSSAVVLFVVLLLQPFTYEGKASAQEAAAPEDNAQNIARELFMKGRIAYDLGNYDEAIAKFQGAYEQMQEPAFLFNIAQAYRLKNDCSRAIDAYRNFLRVGRQSENRDAAESHLSDLRRTCAESRLAPTAVLPAANNDEAFQSPKRELSVVDTTAAPLNRSADNRFGTISTSGFVGTAVLGSLAIALGIWNVHRYKEWSSENDQLSTPPLGTDPAGLSDRQETNDDRLTSIHRTEKFTWGLALGAGVLLMGSVVLRIVGDK